MAPLNRTGVKKVFLVANTGWYLFNFRRPLASAIQAQGLIPVFISPRDAYIEKLIAQGFQWIELPMDRRSMNPVAELKTLLKFIALYRREKPLLAHHFTIKCVLYGTIAALLARTSAVVNSITGLGHVFVTENTKTKILRPLVKLAYQILLGAKHTRVVFQNPDDMQAFHGLKLVRKDRSVLIRSSGVDTQRFSPRPNPATSPPVILFTGRLLVEKGIFEFVEAARLLKKQGLQARFWAAGSTDPGNPSSATESQLEDWKREGLVEWLGHVDRIEDRLAECSVFVLPSYREGVPRSLLEAAAMAKPIVATDVPGCREIVDHEKNGFLVPAQNPEALAQAIAVLLKDESLRIKMGHAGREKALREFNDKDIAAATLKVYSDLGALR